MVQAILNQIIDQLETLELEEIQQLNQVIQRHLTNRKETDNLTRFHNTLLTTGLVKQIKQPAYSQQSERRLIQLKGKPVSETMIEDRH